MSNMTLGTLQDLITRADEQGGIFDSKNNVGIIVLVNGKEVPVTEINWYIDQEMVDGKVVGKKVQLAFEVQSNDGQ